MTAFENLPYPVKQAAVAAYGYWSARHRYGPEFRRYLKLLRESRDWSEDRQQEWQRAELDRLVGSAVTGSRHYAASIGAWPPSNGTDLSSAVARLPLLEKSVVRRDTAALGDSHRKTFRKTVTSGSTGSPMTVEHDKPSTQRLFALFADHRSWVGLDYRSRSIRLSGRILVDNDRPSTRPWLYNPAERQLFLSTYHLNDAHRAIIDAKCRRYRPEVIDGYPSAILTLMELLGDEARSSLRLIVTTAETLDPDVRRRIEALTSAPVLDYYGASEGLPLIQQCAVGTYHVRWQSGIVEVIGDGADHGEMVCTSFIQARTPLIRYRTGDLASGFAPYFRCSCGISSPIVRSVLGRVEDLVRTRDGRALGMFTYRTLKEVPGLAASQVVQEDYERFTVNLVPNGEVAQDVIEREIIDRFTRALGARPEVSFAVMDRLPLGANGKVRLVRSLVKPGAAPTS